MEKRKENIIIKVEKDSIADEMGISPGDILMSINNTAVIDVFDYRYLINDEYIEMCIKDKNGEIYIAEIEKDINEDIGIVFESGLMDNAKSCKNKCMFCFIDQLPPNMRSTLYFKDDDSRLSFLQGNYVTLTNMKTEDIDRIIYYHLSPINISVHTTNLELRKRMLKNNKADKIIEIMKRLADAGIKMNLQIVLCRNINDGEHLDKSIHDLSNFYPSAESLSVVPVGITGFRKNLENLEPFDKESATEVLNQIHLWQKRLKKKTGSAFVFAADEFYLKAGKKIPDSKDYEDFPQIENGVGMIALLKEEFETHFKQIQGNSKIKKIVSIGTGEAAYDFIKSLTEKLKQKFPNIQVKVYKIKNNFFGGEITVSGLLTGKDIVEQLKDKELGQKLILPENILRSGEDVLLDDMTIKDIQKKLNINIRIAENTGHDFISAIVDTEDF